MTRFVLDCSITMAWCFADEANRQADCALDSLAETEAVVPAVWPFEVANVLVMAERRKRLTLADSAQFLAMLQGLPIVIDACVFESVFGAVLATARSHRLTAYDAAYLELAMRRGLPLVTLDEDLQAAANELGIKPFDGD